MRIEFMGAFRKRARDQHGHEKYLRILRGFYLATISGSFWVIAFSASESLYRPMSLSVIMTSAVIWSIAMFVHYGSYKCDETLMTPLRKPFLVPVLMGLTIVAAETAPLGWWNQPVVLERLRYGALCVLAAWFLLWAGEKGIHSRRSRREGIGSPG